jgi:hypothetical protein
MSRLKGNTTSGLEIPSLSRKRMRYVNPHRGKVNPSIQAILGQPGQPQCPVRTPLITNRVYRPSDNSPHSHFRPLRLEPPSSEPLSLPPRSINLRPTCHQCCPGSVSCRISFGTGCFPLPLQFSSGRTGSLWYPIRGGLGRRTVGGRCGAIFPVTGTPLRRGVLRVGSENLIILADPSKVVFPSAGLLGGAGGTGLQAFDMLMRLWGSNSSSE